MAEINAEVVEVGRQKTSKIIIRPERGRDGRDYVRERSLTGPSQVDQEEAVRKQTPESLTHFAAIRMAVTDELYQ